MVVAVDEVKHLVIVGVLKAMIMPGIFVVQLVTGT